MANSGQNTILKFSFEPKQCQPAYASDKTSIFEIFSDGFRNNLQRAYCKFLQYRSRQII